MTDGRWARLLAVPVVLGVFAAGCGGDDDDGGGSEAEAAEAGGGAETTEVSFLIPFPSALTFYSLHVAEQQGYFEEEGIDLQIETADGSGGVVQQLAAGNADTGLAGPGPQLSALAQDQRLVSVYVMSTRIPYSLVTPEDSGISSVQDLEGRTVGISEPTGGEALFVHALLEQEGVDAEVVEAGGGDTASLALQEGRIDAYSSATSDVISVAETFEAAGSGVTDLGMGPFDEFFDVSILVTPEYLEENREVLAGLGRAITKGSMWGIANPDGALAIAQDVDPEAVTDCEPARRRLEAQFPNREPTEAMDGQWGFNVPEVWEATADFLVDNGELESAVDVAQAYDNDLIADINDFDPAEVEADADAFTEEPDC